VEEGIFGVKEEGLVEAAVRVVVTGVGMACQTVRGVVDAAIRGWGRTV